MKKNSYNRKSKGRNNWENNPEYPATFPQGPEIEGKVNNAISIKALSGLPKSSYSVKADPYQASLPVSSPYNILSSFLKKVGGNYNGDGNIDGGNVQQYANSTTSKFLKYFDSFRMKINLNYRYLPILKTTKAGKTLVDEMRKSISEAVSALQSTTFTNLAINNFAIETDLNMGSAKTETTSDGKQIYTNITDVLYAMSVYYQLVLQESLSVMNSHNSFRLKQGTAIRDGWGREVPYLNSFFGLMNKSSFLNLLNSINLSFEGEYVDKDFMEQVNYLSFMPARRSNSITDPVLELQVKFNHPSIFKVHLLDDNGNIIKTIFDDAEMKLAITVDGQSKDISFWEACDQLKNYLSLEATKRWARQIFAQAGTGISAGTDNARFNVIKAFFDVIMACFVYFKPQWADYRECLDTMTRTGAISWTKGFRPSVVKDTDAPLFDNMIVNDIYRMVLSGADSITYNDITKRWATFSQWNMYTGIPEYDQKQGGAFITFSSKLFNAQDETEQLGYLPIMFDPNPSENNIYVVGVSREGKVCNINYAVRQMSTNPVLSRLAPLTSQAALKIRVPRLEWEKNSSNGLDAVDRSTLYKTLTQIFGMAIIDTSASISDIALDPDILAIYQIEISDITNEAITYARANAPFRGTSSGQGLLGFFGVKN